MAPLRATVILHTLRAAASVDTEQASLLQIGKTKAKLARGDDFTEHDGCCRTASEGYGTHTSVTANRAECEAKCAADPACVAFELNTKFWDNCELHKDAITHAGECSGFGLVTAKCGIRVEKTPSPPPPVPVADPSKVCKQACRKVCMKDKDCKAKGQEEKKACNQACKKTCQPAYKDEKCTSFAALVAAKKAAKKCKKSWKKSCIQESKCKDLWPAEKAACKKACKQSAKTSWQGGQCSAYTSEAKDHVCGTWSAWSKCSAACGGGLQTREYKFFDGNKCGLDCDHGDGDKEQQTCNLAPCTVDCEGSWSEYSSCSATCGGGVQDRVYSITRASAHGGKACPKASGAEESHACSQEPCETDCQGHWEEWSECSNGGAGPDGMECGPGGKQHRDYTVTVDHTPGGCGCEATMFGATSSVSITHGTKDEKDCDLPCCPEPCEGSWGDWGTCQGENLGSYEVDGGYGETACCGGGSKTKKFTVTKPKVCGGECCTAAHDEEMTAPCCETPCPVDCEGHWEVGTECSTWCDPGTTTDIFVVTQEAMHGGEVCEAKHGDTRDKSCTKTDVHPPTGKTWVENCPEPCEGDWGEWGNCSVTCENSCSRDGEPSPKGTMSRAFVVTKEALYGGEKCSEKGQTESISCGKPGLPEDPQPCPVDAVCKWTEWGECSEDCSNGPEHYIFRTRKWIEVKPAKNGGCECKDSPPAYELDEEPCAVPLEVPRCPIPCIGHWSKFEKCTAKLSVPGAFHCGGGSKTRTYIITQEAQFGGAECCNNHGEKDAQDCGERPCEVPCIGEFNEWSDCCTTCGGGSKSRVFEVSQPAKHGGPNCSHKDGHKEIEQCGMDPCPIDCVGSWNEWSECSQQCTDCQSYGSIGSKSRKFTVTVQAQHGGKQCPHEHDTVEEKVCNDKCCPVDCVGSWNEFSQCSSSCGNGVKERAYFISQPALYGGVECPRCHNSTHTVACNDGACPVHCSGKWSAYGHCSKECDGGEKTSWFLIDTHAQNGGTACEHAAYATQKAECNTHACFSPCRGGFSVWSKCSKPCGGGQKNRTYTVRSPGKGMPAIPCSNADGFVQTNDCNTHECPQGYVCSGNCD